MIKFARTLVTAFVAAIGLGLAACSGGGGGSSPSPGGGGSTPSPTASPTASSTAQPATMSVDFSKARSQASMSGFLLSQFNASSNNTFTIPTSLITPLKPAYWRGAVTDPGISEPNLVALLPGLTYIDILSNSYGYPSSGGWSSTGSTTPPFDLAPYQGNGISAWEQTVQKVVQSVAGRSEIIFEEWNEPDGVDNNSQFFYGTEAQAFTTMDEAYTTVKNTESSAKVAGPAEASYLQSPGFLTDYLTYCVQSSCAVNYLTFHDNSEDSNIPLVATQLQTIRALSASSQYAPLQVQKIVVDEYTGPQSDRVPGDIAAYLYYLEQGGAAGAAKACWTSPQGTNECFDGSLDGIIDPATNEQRAAWWVYKYYADGVASRVTSTTSDPSLIALASSSSAMTGAAQILVGAIDVNGAAPSTSSPSIQVQNLASVSSLAGLSSVTVRITPIAATDVTPVPSLPTPAVSVVPVSNGACRIVVPIQAHAAALVTISAS